MGLFVYFFLLLRFCFIEFFANTSLFNPGIELMSLLQQPLQFPPRPMAQNILFSKGLYAKIFVLLE